MVSASHWLFPGAFTVKPGLRALRRFLVITEHVLDGSVVRGCYFFCHSSADQLNRAKQRVGGNRLRGGRP